MEIVDYFNSLDGAEKAFYIIGHIVGVIFLLIFIRWYEKRINAEELFSDISQKLKNAKIKQTCNNYKYHYIQKYSKRLITFKQFISSIINSIKRLSLHYSTNNKGKNKSGSLKMWLIVSLLAIGGILLGFNISLFWINISDLFVEVVNISIMCVSLPFVYLLFRRFTTRNDA